MAHGVEDLPASAVYGAVGSGGGVSERNGGTTVTSHKEFYANNISDKDRLLLEEFRKFDERRAQREAEKRGAKLLLPKAKAASRKVRQA
jgi:hypothetical protein